LQPGQVLGSRLEGLGVAAGRDDRGHRRADHGYGERSELWRGRDDAGLGPDLSRGEEQRDRERQRARQMLFGTRQWTLRSAPAISPRRQSMATLASPYASRRAMPFFSRSWIIAIEAPSIALLRSASRPTVA